MAKFNITVELDWIDEEGGIDNIVKEEIIHNIASRFSNKLNEDILETAQKKVSEQINSCIDVKVNEIIETMLNKEFPLIDRYGDIVKEKVTVIGLIKERLDNFLEEKVNKEGIHRGYDCNQTRLDYIISKNIDYSMQRKIEDAAKQVKVGLEKYMSETIKKQIGENVSTLIGLDKMISTK